MLWLHQYKFASLLRTAKNRDALPHLARRGPHLLISCVFSAALDRNPEPPAELMKHKELIEADTIGSTVFSKHWLITTLMKLIKVIDLPVLSHCMIGCFLVFLIQTRKENGDGKGNGAVQISVVVGDVKAEMCICFFSLEQFHQVRFETEIIAVNIHCDILWC